MKPPLTEDLEFVRAMTRAVQSTGLMQNPTFNPASSQLTEGRLALDLFNVWHATQQLDHPESRTIVDNWLRPKHLGHACYFGRADVVQSAIDKGLPLDGEDYGGNPIAAAFEAYVTTPLHLRCVELLFEAGARATLGQFEANLESVGSKIDGEMRRLLVEHALRSADPAVHAKAVEWSHD